MQKSNLYPRYEYTMKQFFGPGHTGRRRFVSRVGSSEDDQRRGHVERALWYVTIGAAVTVSNNGHLACWRTHCYKTQPAATLMGSDGVAGVSEVVANRHSAVSGVPHWVSGLQRRIHPPPLREVLNQRHQQRHEAHKAGKRQPDAMIPMFLPQPGLRGRLAGRDNRASSNDQGLMRCRFNQWSRRILPSSTVRLRSASVQVRRAAPGRKVS